MSDERKLIEKQIEAISDLQEQIKLLRFDLSEASKEKTNLKNKLKQKNETFKKVKQDLVEIKINKDYERLKEVIKYIREKENEK